MEMLITIVGLILLTSVVGWKMIKLSEKKTCRTCIHAIGGVCTEGEGDNYGHQTEVSDNGYCINWEV